MNNLKTILGIFDSSTLNHVDIQKSTEEYLYKKYKHPKLDSKVIDTNTYNIWSFEKGLGWINIGLNYKSIKEELKDFIDFYKNEFTECINFKEFLNFLLNLEKEGI